MITSYDTMPFGVYLKIADIIEQEHDPLSFQVALIAALDGLTEDQVLDLPVDQFKAKAAQLAFLETPPPKANPTRPPRVLKLGAYDCRIIDDASAMNTAQFVDYQQLLAQGRDAWPAILAVFVVPYGKTYGHSGDDDPKAYDLQAVQDAIREEVSIVQIQDWLAFFFRRWLRRFDRSMTSLNRAVTKLAKKAGRPDLTTEMLRQWQALREFGDGWMQ